ncbi:MAG: RNA-binding protein [Clostridiales bacterium]|nr:MAG: RNA-binding protein [Clostridiales bacterium]
MKELVKMIVSNLVTKPEEVEINQTETDTDIIFEIKVSSDDIGRVIGKKGRIINAIRIVVKSAGLNSGKNVMVEIMN